MGVKKQGGGNQKLGILLNRKIQGFFLIEKYEIIKKYGGKKWGYPKKKGFSLVKKYRNSFQSIFVRILIKNMGVKKGWGIKKRLFLIEKRGILSD